MSENESVELWKDYETPPSWALKTIKGGRMSGKTDINPQWRIMALTDKFGLCGVGWYYNTVKEWTEQAGEEIACFVNIELFIKSNGEWSKPIRGTGGSMFYVQEKSRMHCSDECYKMATTDAISVACKQLGIGSTVYCGMLESKYQNNRQPQQKDALNQKIDREIKKLEASQHNEALVALCVDKGYIKAGQTLSDMSVTDKTRLVKQQDAVIYSANEFFNNLKGK